MSETEFDVQEMVIKAKIPTSILIDEKLRSVDIAEMLMPMLRGTVIQGIEDLREAKSW